MTIQALCNQARRLKWQKPEKLVSKHAKAALRQAAQALAASIAAPGEAPPSAHALFRPATLADGAERLSTLVRLTANVLLAHRQDIRDLAHLSTGQLAELKVATANPAKLFRAIDLLADLGHLDDEELASARRELRSMCDLKGRMVALGMLTAQFERLQVMERKAFGIRDDERPEDEEDDVAAILVEFVNAPARIESGEFPTPTSSVGLSS